MKHILKAILMLCATATSADLWSQRAYDVVYLKDSSVIYGVIIQMDTDHQVTIAAEDKKVYVIDANRVARIVRTTVAGPMPPAYRMGYNVKTEKGYYNEWEMGLNMGVRDDSWWRNQFTASFTLSIVNGYQWSRYLRTGAGLGIDVYDGFPYSPIFLRAGGNLFDGPVSLLYWGEIGHALSWDATNQKGGRMVGFGSGMRFNSRGAASFHLGFGYRFQKTTWEFEGVDWQGNPVHDIEVRMFNRVALRCGFSF